MDGHRSRNSGIIRLFLLATLLALITGGAYLWKGHERSLDGISLGPASREVRDLFGRADASITDAWTTAKVKTALLLSKRVAASDVDVDSHGSEVTLSGKVPSAEAKAVALTLAVDTTGVASVVDHLTVGGAPSLEDPREEERRLSDLELQVRVYEALLGDDVVHAGNVRVRVADGVVTLTGTVPTDLDERYAEAITASVDGVDEVASELVIARDDRPPTS